MSIGKTFYLVKTGSDSKSETEDIVRNVEYGGFCSGYIIAETTDGFNIIGAHCSSTTGWLRIDLMDKLSPEQKEGAHIVDLLKEPYEKLPAGIKELLVKN